MLNKNDWIETEDGICQVVLTQNIDGYILGSENSSEEIRYIWYKILFDSSGELRKRKFFNYLAEKYCMKISEKSLVAVNDFRKGNEKEFNIFKSRKPPSRPKMSVGFSIRADKNKVSEVVESIDLFLNSIEKPFVYDTFISGFNSNVTGVESGLLPSVADSLSSNIMISLEFELFSFESSKIDFIGGAVYKTHCVI